MKAPKTQGQAKSVERPHRSARCFLRSGTSTPPSPLPEAAVAVVAAVEPSRIRLTRRAIGGGGLRCRPPVSSQQPPSSQQGGMLISCLEQALDWTTTAGSTPTRPTPPIETHHRRRREPCACPPLTDPAAAAMGAAVVLGAGTQSFPGSHFSLSSLNKPVLDCGGVGELSLLLMLLL
jgi:hypothetical protein